MSDYTEKLEKLFQDPSLWRMVDSYSCMYKGPLATLYVDQSGSVSAVRFINEDGPGSKSLDYVSLGYYANALSLYEIVHKAEIERKNEAKKLKAKEFVEKYL
jgi:hypothetical protein